MRRTKHVNQLSFADLIFEGVGSNYIRLNIIDNKHFNVLFTAWRKVQNFDELVINKTSNVEVEKAEQKDENGNVVSLEVQISITTVTECSDENTAPVDAVFIMVPGNWRRIKYKQGFKKTQRCYALFGSVPSW